jgi:signal transduction histidine kinase
MRIASRRWWHPSIRKQLVFAVVGVHALLILTIIPDFIHHQRILLIERSKVRAESQADLLAASAVPQLTTNDLAGLTAILDALGRDGRVRFAMVTDRDGLILGHTDARHVGEYLIDPPSRKQLQLKTSAGRAVVADTFDLIEIATPIVVNNSVLGWAWVAGDRTSDNEQIASLVQSGATYAAMAIGLGILVAIVIASTITKPLRLLLAGAGRLARDNFDVPVQVTTRTEVGTLAEALNNAMEKLKANRTALEQARVELEAEVAERRRAQEKLESANRIILSANENLRQFAYAISHDLQEPLRAVSSFSELLNSRYRDALGTEGGEFVDYIREGAVRAQDMIRAVLEYSRAGGRGDAVPEPVNASAALRIAQENLRAAIEDRRAIIDSSDLPVVRAQEVAVAQLFQNLIGNAIKYCEVEPRIRVSAEREGTHWRFAIADNGIGVDPRDHARIFRIFTRARAGSYPGTGIGLAICSKIVERYGGRIWVDSEIGAGSTFYFTLPADNRSFENSPNLSR